ncbi:MAG: hypothetical protein U0694_01690 [Anaerolineae bacterium]
MRIAAAIASVVAAVALLFSLALLWFAPAPIVDVEESGTHIIFSASQPIILDRCGQVRWQVDNNSGVWVNGVGVASEGITSTCIDRHFTRPQISVLLPDGNWRLYELPVTSLIYSGPTALTFALRFTLAGLLLLLAARLAGWRFPTIAVGARRVMPTPKISLALCAFLWLIYIAANLYLRLNTPITSAPAEAYITSTTIQQAWDSAERPITIPLLYKLLHNDFEAIASLQWAVSLLSWSALAGVTLLYQSGCVCWPARCFLALRLARDVYFWNSVLISESLSQSLFILLLALGMFALWVYRRWSNRDVQASLRLSLVTQIAAAFWIILLTVIWSFTRDTNSYLVLAMGLLLAAGVAWFLLRSKGRAARLLLLPSLLALAFVALFLFQSADANRGLRWRYPLMNIIARRVLPYPENTAFFAARGMPTTPDVMRFAGQFAWAYDLSPIEPWLTQDSRRVYLQFLLSDPLATVLAPINQWEMLLLFDYRVIDEHRPDIVLPSWIETLTGFAYPEHLGLVIVSIVGLLLLALWAWRAPDVRLAIVFVLLLLLYPLAFMVWYGDGFAVERHAVPSALQWRLTLWLSIVFALDALSSRSKLRLSRL